MTFSSMTARETELWAKIETFPLDQPEVALPFSCRLARENGWILTKARRVIEEYRRFLFLTERAGHPVSPPDEVDQAWHLHLVYTKSYWRDLCQEVLGHPLHHEPTEGGLAETAKYRGWYEQTLASYRRYFGEPPEDLWPPAERRIQSKREQWVDVSRHWLVPRPKLLRRVRPMLLAGAGACLLMAAILPGCLDERSLFDARGPDFLFFYTVGFFIALGLSWILPRYVMGDPGLYRTSEISDPYDIAFLGAGGTRTLDAALTALFARKAIEVRQDRAGKTLIQPKALEKTEGFHAVESLVYKSLPQERETSFQQIRRSLAPAMEAIREKLENAGLFLSGAQRRSQSLAAAAPLLLLLALGGIKIFVGISRGKPVLFLCLLCVGTVVAMIVRLNKLNRRSALGEATWQKLQVSSKPDIARDGIAVAPLAVALIGAEALMAPGFYSLHSALNRPRMQSTNGCGSGSGCSTGSSCGGGGSCGSSGCGGCGGGGH